jgi:predicted site-specific integrase-resolvase
MSVLPLNEA